MKFVPTAKTYAFSLFIFISCNVLSQGVGINTSTPKSALDVEGGVAIGATYSGTSPAPGNGLIVEGNVGIGTSSPIGPLTVQGDRTSNRGDHFTVRGTTNANLKGYFGIDTDAATPYLAINFVEETVAWRNIAIGNGGTASKVGIGVVTPVNKLDVEGAAAIGATYSGTSTAPANGLIVEGSVGIGTSSPTTGTLDVSSLGSALRLRAGNNSTLYTRNQVLFSWNGGANYTHAIKTRHHGGQDADNAIDFFIWDFGTDAAGTVGTKRVMSIDGDGTGKLDMNSNKIVNLATPTVGTDAVNKDYVDAAGSGCAGTYERSSTTGAKCVDATAQCGAGYHLCTMLEIHTRSHEGNVILDQGGDATYHWVYTVNTAGTKQVRGVKYDYETNVWTMSNLACVSTWNIYSICCSD